MGDGKPFLFLHLCLLTIIFIPSSVSDDRQTYIVHMDKSAIPDCFSNHRNWYASTLSSLSSRGGVRPSHLYTYEHVIHGFSAVLSQSQLEQLERMPGHIAAFPETFGHFHTTHSNEFIGLKRNVGLWPRARFGENMIIGIIDSGVWPESKSFDDKGMPPVPARWHGTCETGTQFNSSNCNNKLIGARYFNKAVKHGNSNISEIYDYDSPRDWFGHGTHTASTAAGSPVPFADYFGYARGTAIGMAPKAHLAIYKVHFHNFPIYQSDLLAGMDQAIADGVDLMSISLGFTSNAFYKDPIALGAFAAMEKGIFVSCAAGNNGHSVLLNDAPWITTVGAGTVDRDFAGHIKLGNGTLSVTGRSSYPENMFVSRVPLYFGRGNRSKEICMDNSLDPSEVGGKFIFCDLSKKTEYYKQVAEFNRAGAAGAIISSDNGFSIRVNKFNTPFVVVKPEDGVIVKNYTTNSDNPVVTVNFQKTVLGTKRAPQVLDSSSRGPSVEAPWVLKPDIIAPGHDILGAWVPNKPGGALHDEKLGTDYIIRSGTSMACPHVVGIAALLKSVHPDWSSAAIRSALMTTADVLDNTKSKIIDMATGVAATPLDFGAGHVNPNKASDPGLVYDIEVQDYINFLCGMIYTKNKISIITRKSSNFSCNANLDLNYPSFIAILNNGSTTSYTFKRVLTNVGDPDSRYTAEVVAPPGMEVVVHPRELYFPEKYSKAEFKLTVEFDLKQSSQSGYHGAHGYLSWFDDVGKHVVRSPIVSAFVP